MTITLPDGTEQRVQIGQTLRAKVLVALTITAGDTRHPQFFEWLLNDVLPRLTPQ